MDKQGFGLKDYFGRKTKKTQIKEAFTFTADASFTL
jgi:hypothetical protein